MSILFSTHCGIIAEQLQWERWQARAYAIAVNQSTKAVFRAIDAGRDSRLEIEESAWEAYCEGQTPRSWCARIAWRARIA